MAVRPIEVTVGTDQFLFSVLPATEGLKVFGKLMGIVGPAVAKADLADKEELSEGAILSAIGELLHQLGAQNDDALFVVQGLLHDLSKNSRPVNFGQEFAGNYGVLVKLLMAGINENFGSFLGGSLDIQQLGAAAKTAFLERSTLTSASGGSSLVDTPA